MFFLVTKREGVWGNTLALGEGRGFPQLGVGENPRAQRPSRR